MGDIIWSVVFINVKITNSSHIFTFDLWESIPLS